MEKMCLNCVYYHRPICAKNRVVDTGYAEPCKLAKFDEYEEVYDFDDDWCDITNCRLRNLAYYGSIFQSGILCENKHIIGSDKFCTKCGSKPKYRTFLVCDCGYTSYKNIFCPFCGKKIGSVDIQFIQYKKAQQEYYTQYKKRKKSERHGGSF